MGSHTIHSIVLYSHYLCCCNILLQFFTILTHIKGILYCLLYSTIPIYSSVLLSVKFQANYASYLNSAMTGEEKLYGSLSQLYDRAASLIQMKDQTAGSLSQLSVWRISSSQGCWDPSDNAVDKATEGKAISSTGLNRSTRCFALSACNQYSRQHSCSVTADSQQVFPVPLVY